MAKKDTTTQELKKKVGRPAKAKVLDPTFTEAPRHDWNSEHEVALFLASLVRLTKARSVLEVGVFEGMTTVELIAALPKGGLFVGIDIQDYITLENKAKMNAATNRGVVVDFFLDNSHQKMNNLPKNHFDLIFIDGNHEYNHVLTEFKLAEKLITQNGIIAFHDSIHIEGVKSVVEYASSWKYNVVNLNTPEGRGLALVMKGR
jgi:predicted O-methyltransferase YrrM